MKLIHIYIYNLLLTNQLFTLTNRTVSERYYVSKNSYHIRVRWARLSRDPFAPKRTEL